MTFRLTADQQEIRDQVLRICARFDDDYWLDRDRNGGFPHELHRAMADGAWLGIAMPEAVGGAGLGITEATIMMQAIAESGAGASGASAIHMNIFGLNPVVKFGTAEQKARMLKPLIEGREKACFAVTEPTTGLDTTKLRTMADRNAEIHLIRGTRSRSLEKAAADDAARLLGLDTLDHIVCFDMSQTLGKERGGASVVLREGRPSKEDYRTYRVRSDAQDDLRMMSEAVSRWAKRQEEWPDLLLLDGGETHLSAIERTLDGMGLLGLFPIAALAKREESLHMRGKETILLDRKGRALVHARDEAHRFSNAFHKRRRGKGALADPLEEVDGLGAKKIQALLRHFGGRKGIEHASVKDLRDVPGIGKEMAERIRAHIQRR